MATRYFAPAPQHSGAGTPVVSRRFNQWLSRRKQHRSEHRLATALNCASDPGLILDVSVGGGTFWPVLMEKPSRRVLAAAASLTEITAAREALPPAIATRIYPFRTGLVPISLHDGAVECVLCMGRWESGLDQAQRLGLLREFHRVTRETVILSVCVQDNVFEAAIQRDIIQKECVAAGFTIRARLDWLPLFSSNCLYVLQKQGME